MSSPFVWEPNTNSKISNIYSELLLYFTIYPENCNTCRLSRLLYPYKYIIDFILLHIFKQASISHNHLIKQNLNQYTSQVRLDSLVAIHFTLILIMSSLFFPVSTISHLKQKKVFVLLFNYYSDLHISLNSRLVFYSCKF